MSCTTLFEGKLKQTLEKNVQSGVLVTVDKPTDWVHNLIIVKKRMDPYAYVLIKESLIK